MTDEEETPAAAAAAVADTPTPTTNNENENDNNNNDTSTSIIEPKQEEEEEEEEDHHQNEDAPESSSTPPGEEDEEDADHGADAADAANTPMMASEDPSEAAVQVHKKKRLCRRPGCSKVIKSQGHCQRHGAKAKRCKVDGCDKQAQGTHDGMCKRHWKSVHWPEAAAGVAGGGGGGRAGVANPNQSFSSLGNSNSNSNSNNLMNGNGGNHNKVALLPPAPEGESVYDSILPQSISYRPTLINKSSLPDLEPGEDPPPPPSGISVMPLVGFLREGATSREVGWHRNAERRSRGLFPISNLSVQLEPWERQLALVEILLLSGGTPYANFRDLAHAWGRDKGFHQVIVNHVCERRGEVERKRRCDAGKPLTEDRLENFRTKYKRSRPSNSSSSRHPNNNYGTNPTEQQEQMQMQPPHHHQEDDSNHGMVLPPSGGEAAAAAAAMMEETTTTATVMTTTLPGSMAPPPNVTATEI